ncbi:MAG: hypothetical protein IBX40_05445 [Methanosarcinales archaeon]|nr:hypothetical protein [Methanosarcinales archaeon]
MIIDVKMSNTACASVKIDEDLEKNAIPDIRSAMTLNIKKICLICSFFQSMLYVNERIAIVLKYPIRTRGKFPNIYLGKSRSNVTPINFIKTNMNLEI